VTHISSRHASPRAYLGLWFRRTGVQASRAPDSCRSVLDGKERREAHFSVPYYTSRDDTVAESPLPGSHSYGIRVTAVRLRGERTGPLLLGLQ